MTPFKNLISLKMGAGGGGGGSNFQTKSVSYTPSESQQTAQVKPDSGYDALSKVNVTVDAISSSYVGSAIDRRDSTDLSASGATVTAPAGYYESAATKTLDEQAAQTIHPSTTDQTIASGKYLTGAQTIKAVTTTNLTAANIVNGVTVEIGDADDSDCVASVTGTASGGTDTLAQRLNNELTTYEYTGTADLFPRIFYGCTNLVSASFPNVTSIGSGNGTDNHGEFTGCTNLESVYFPELLEIKDGNAFEQCKKLSAIFPKLTTIAKGYVFNNCGNTMMHTFVLPSITTMGNDTFRTTSAIVDLGNGLTSLQARVFYGNNITYPTIIFRCSTQVVSLSSDNSIAALSADTTIYIPKALYDHLGDGTALDYKAATNWITKANIVTFACIEGSQYENYYADGTPIPTT